LAYALPITLLVLSLPPPRLSNILASRWVSMVCLTGQILLLTGLVGFRIDGMADLALIRGQARVQDPGIHAVTLEITKRDPLALGLAFFPEMDSFSLWEF